jgi:hypothetical protein
VVSEKDLIRVVEDRIVANEVGSSDVAIMAPMSHDLTTTDIAFLRENKMKIWW